MKKMNAYFEHVLWALQYGLFHLHACVIGEPLTENINEQMTVQTMIITTTKRTSL